MLAAWSRPGTRSLMRFSGPLSDVLTTKTGFVIEVELPGVKKDAINIQCDNNTVHIEATKNEPYPKEWKKLHAERSFGPMKRRFQLPRSADLSKIDAELANGLLTLTVPRRDSQKFSVTIK